MEQSERGKRPACLFDSAFRPGYSKNEAERSDSEKPEIHKTRFANLEFANHKAANPKFEDLFQGVEFLLPEHGGTAMAGRPAKSPRGTRCARAT